VGLGNIGSLVAMKAVQLFGMKILYHDVVRKSQEQDEELNAWFCERLDDFLKEADFVVVATLFMGEKVITASTLGKMKRGARLRNVTRGGLVGEDALADALGSRHIFAAGLDVYENEPHINLRLLSKELETYVTLTYHNAGDAVETHVDFERLSNGECCESCVRGRAVDRSEAAYDG
jgi:lactate dehydrogenase-like 2-hydroxyacid dehydrogenase